MNVPREPYYKKELDLRLSMSYGPGRYDSRYEEQGQDYPFAYVRWTEQRNMQAFLELVAERKVLLKPLITHRFPIEQAESAYALMMEGKQSYIAMVITYPSDRARSLPRIIPVGKGQAGRPVTMGIIGRGQPCERYAAAAAAGLEPGCDSRHLHRLRYQREDPCRKNRGGLLHQRRPVDPGRPGDQLRLDRHAP
jgi:hypothetical protein